MAENGTQTGNSATMESRTTNERRGEAVAQRHPRAMGTGGKQREERKGKGRNGVHGQPQNNPRPAKRTSTVTTTTTA